MRILPTSGASIERVKDGKDVTCLLKCDRNLLIEVLIKKLPEKQMRVIDLWIIKDKPIRFIGRELKCSARTVYRLIKKANAKMKAMSQELERKSNIKLR